MNDTVGTDNQESQPASRHEELYLGEPAPRRPGVAFALSWLAPGLGWAYLGRPGTAIAVNLLFLCLWLGLVAAWSLLGFFPLFPAAVVLIGWFALNLMCAADAWLAARRSGGSHVLGDANHPLVYIGIAVLTWLLPLIALHHVTFDRLWMFAAVEGESMYPTLLPGDRLLVDRRRFEQRSPKRGEVVLLRPPDGGDRLLLSRVIGVPGDAVVLADDVPFVNDAPLPRSSVDVTAVPGIDDAVLRSRSDALSYGIESNGPADYLVAIPRAAFHGQSLEWTLDDGEYLVLNDNRSTVTDSRTFGAVERDLLVGGPTYIAFRRVPAGPWSTSRTGLRIQPSEL